MSECVYCKAAGISWMTSVPNDILYVRSKAGGESSRYSHHQRVLRLLDGREILPLCEITRRNGRWQRAQRRKDS